MSSDVPPKIQWACRRGMLELDMLLKNFATVHYAALTEQEKADFARLLTAYDQDLFAWLFNAELPEIEDLHAIIKRIRRYAHPNF